MATIQKMADMSEGGIKSLTELYDVINGKETRTSGGSTTTTESAGISQDSMNAMLKSALEGTNGLAAISSGQRAAGGYGSSVNTLLTNDLLSRTAGQIAASNRTSTRTTTTTPTKTTVGGVTAKGAVKSGSFLAALQALSKSGLLEKLGKKKDEVSGGVSAMNGDIGYTGALIGDSGASAATLTSAVASENSFGALPASGDLASYNSGANYFSDPGVDSAQQGAPVLQDPSAGFYDVPDLGIVSAPPVMDTSPVFEFTDDPFILPGSFADGGAVTRRRKSLLLPSQSNVIGIDNSGSTGAGFGGFSAGPGSSSAAVNASAPAVYSANPNQESGLASSPGNDTAQDSPTLAATQTPTPGNPASSSGGNAGGLSGNGGAQSNALAQEANNIATTTGTDPLEALLSITNAFGTAGSQSDALGNAANDIATATGSDPLDALMGLTGSFGTESTQSNQETAAGLGLDFGFIGGDGVADVGGVTQSDLGSIGQALGVAGALTGNSDLGLAGTVGQVAGSSNPVGAGISTLANAMTGGLSGTAMNLANNPSLSTVADTVLAAANPALSAVNGILGLMGLGTLGQIASNAVAIASPNQAMTPAQQAAASEASQSGAASNIAAAQANEAATVNNADPLDALMEGTNAFGTGAGISYGPEGNSGSGTASGGGGDGSQGTNGSDGYGGLGGMDTSGGYGNMGGFADGGPIRGPGNGISDSIATRVRPGSYIVPADIVAMVGTEHFDKLEEKYTGLKPAGAGPDVSGVPAKVSNGEYKLSPATVRAVGIDKLDKLVDKYHVPAAVQKLKNFANGGYVGARRG